MDVSALVQQMHENLSTIHETISGLSTESHETLLSELEQKREALLEQLRAQFDKEQEEVSAKRQAENDEISEKRRIEDEEIAARRKLEDDDVQSVNDAHDLVRHEKLDDDIKQIDEETDKQMDEVEEAARQIIEETRHRILELEEKRKEINRLIDEQLQLPLPEAPKRKRARDEPPVEESQDAEPIADDAPVTEEPSPAEEETHAEEAAPPAEDAPTAEEAAPAEEVPVEEAPEEEKALVTTEIGEPASMPQSSDLEDQPSNHDYKAPEAETPPPVSDNTSPAEAESIVDGDDDGGIVEEEEPEQSEVEQSTVEEPQLSKDLPNGGDDLEQPAEDSESLEDSQPTSLQVADSGIGLDPEVEAGKPRPASPVGSVSRDMEDDEPSDVSDVDDSSSDEKPEEVVEDLPPFDMDTADKSNADLNASQQDPVSTSDEPVSTGAEPEDAGTNTTSSEAPADTLESEKDLPAEQESTYEFDQTQPVESMAVPTELPVISEEADDEVPIGGLPQPEEAQSVDSDNIDQPSQPIVEAPEAVTAEDLDLTPAEDFPVEEPIQTEDSAQAEEPVQTEGLIEIEESLQAEDPVQTGTDIGLDLPDPVSSDHSEFSLDQADVVVDDERSLVHSRSATPIQSEDADEAVTSSQMNSPAAPQSPGDTISVTTVDTQGVHYDELPDDIDDSAYQAVDVEQSLPLSGLTEANESSESPLDSHEADTAEMSATSINADISGDESSYLLEVKQESSGPIEDHDVDLDYGTEDATVEQESRGPIEDHDTGLDCDTEDATVDISVPENSDEVIAITNLPGEEEDVSVKVEDEQPFTHEPSQLAEVEQEMQENHEPSQLAEVEQEMQENHELTKSVADSTINEGGDPDTSIQSDTSVGKSLDISMYTVDAATLIAAQQDEEHDASVDLDGNHGDDANLLAASGMKNDASDHEQSLAEELHNSTLESIEGEAGSHILSSDSDVESRVAGEEFVNSSKPEIFTEQELIPAASSVSSSLSDFDDVAGIEIASGSQDGLPVDRVVEEELNLGMAEPSNQSIMDKSEDSLETGPAGSESQVGTSSIFPFNKDFSPQPNASSDHHYRRAESDWEPERHSTPDEEQQPAEAREEYGAQRYEKTDSHPAERHSSVESEDHEASLQRSLAEEDSSHYTLSYYGDDFHDGDKDISQDQSYDGQQASLTRSPSVDMSHDLTAPEAINGVSQNLAVDNAPRSTTCSPLPVENVTVQGHENLFDYESTSSNFSDDEDSEIINSGFPDERLARNSQVSQFSPGSYDGAGWGDEDITDDAHLEPYTAATTLQEPTPTPTQSKFNFANSFGIRMVNDAERQGESSDPMGIRIVHSTEQLGESARRLRAQTPNLAPIGHDNTQDISPFVLQGVSPTSPSKGGLLASRHAPGNGPQTPTRQAERPMDQEQESESDPTMFAPRDVTNVPWHARNDSEPFSLRSQSTLSSAPSSPIHSALPIDKHEPVIRDSWHGPIGSASRSRTNTHFTDRNSGDDFDPFQCDPTKSSSYDINSPRRSTQVHQPLAETNRNSMTGSPMFQKLRNMFEGTGGSGGGSGGGSPSGIVSVQPSPTRSRPVSSIFNPVGHNRSSSQLRESLVPLDPPETPRKGRFSNAHEDEVDENSALLSDTAASDLAY